ncbi:MAG: FAD-dependent oxidoreductase [Planctomycetota bacterium]
MHWESITIMGFSVTLYEMEPVLAGMLATGIPEYRLPRDLIRAEVEVITSLGVEAVTSCCVGRDVTFGELRAKHDAVVVAVGYKRSRQLSIPGGDAEGILGGVEFLRAVALGKPPPLGERVLVIGGGNVAYDVGRTVLRQIAVDAARSARRAAGVAEVHLCSLESLEEMPADDIEIIEGDEEGILRHNSLGPQDFKVDERGRVRGVRFQRCLRVFDEERRFRPLFDADDVTELPCDTALVAIGQVFDISFIDPERDGIRLRPTGLIDSDPETGETSAGDVFVAGDLVHGPKLLIHAVASGKAVARAIYRRLTGRRIHMEAADLHLPLAEYRRVPDFEKRRRLRPEALPVAERLEGQQREVEKGFTREQAHYEASRCLDCAVNTIFDGSRCILCGGCAEVCPEQCLRLVGVEECFQGEELRALLERQAGGIPPGDATVIVKDETRCIRCALCAERCPTGAITMERFLYQERFLCHVG